MIELVDLRKSYKTDSFEQVALDGVSLNFRDNEFVAILGPSGSGKTTLLNIVGGLDHADSGDIVINSVSTRDYRNSDWDTYRNYHIGFIFQSYNLIPHQTVAANVELALTLAGVSRTERRERAVAALQSVGLGDHVNKKPSQLSGGQMQRVAIARALVNDPDIVLADEPTGALDTETGVQVMDILKQVANDRLVIMVTHNPELAEAYATRIVRLSDGQIVSDSDPCDLDEDATGVLSGGSMATGAVMSGAEAATGDDADGMGASAGDTRPSGSGKKASMSFLTALSLSFNNLMTKKGRTFLTAFAGSIGIIGIAAILALSNGVNNYINETEEDALTSYPLTVTKSSFDMSSLFTYSMGGSGTATKQAADSNPDDSGLISQDSIMSDMFAQVKNNDLASFKRFLESDESGVGQYVNTIQYNYGVTPRIYLPDTTDGITQLNPSNMEGMLSSGFTGSALSTGAGMSPFYEMLDNRSVLESQMDVVAGRWPGSYDECVLVLSSDGAITDYTLYSLGFYDPSVMEQMTEDALNGDTVTVPETSEDFTYDDALAMRFKVVPSTDLYSYNADQGIWTDMTSDTDYMRSRIADGIDLKVVGVVQPASTSNNVALQEGIAYTPELISHLIDEAAASDIVKQQQGDPDVDVFTGKTFDDLQSEQQQSFDMSSMFTIDEDAIANAFSFDSSSLDTSGMNLDLSSIDMSGMSIDTSSMDIDTGALDSAFDADTMTQLLQGAPQPDMSSVDTSLSEEDQAAVDAVSASIVNGFLPYWYEQHPGESIGPDTDFTADFAAYMATEEVQGQLDEINLITGRYYRGSAEQMMQDYMTNQFAPYIQSAMRQMMSTAAETLMTQMQSQIATSMAAATDRLGSELSSAISGQLENSMSQLSDSLQSGFSVDAEAFANAIQFNMSQDDLTSLLSNYMNATETTYDSNLSKLGYAEYDNPQSISIYPKDFASKQSVLDIIDGYNDDMSARGRADETIQYSDIAGALMSSVTRIVDTISLVLIAFVSISLVVSSIMIGIITYISVLERKKEIGILRAMGASKGNIANVFNAETIIEGLIAGVLAIAVVMVVSVPVNIFVENGWNVPNIMSLPWGSALILIAISVVLTLVAGLIPSTSASRRDPVEALRSE